MSSLNGVLGMYVIPFVSEVINLSLFSLPLSHLLPLLSLPCQSCFFGSYEQRVSTIALCQLLSHCVNTGDQRLNSIAVMEEEASNLSDGKYCVLSVFINQVLRYSHS